MEEIKAIIVVILSIVAFSLEGMAHGNQIVNSWGSASSAEIERDRMWHKQVFYSWIALTAVIITFFGFSALPLVFMQGTCRFLFHGLWVNRAVKRRKYAPRSLFYLSDKGIDGKIKQIGEMNVFYLKIALFVTSVIILLW